LACFYVSLLLELLRTKQIKKPDCNSNKINVLHIDGTVQVSDSAIYEEYLEEKYTDIVYSHYILDNDLKLGLFSASLTETGHLDSALRVLPHFNDIKFVYRDYDSSCFIISDYFDNFDLSYPAGMGPYEKWALYKYETKIHPGDPKWENILIYNFIDKNNPMNTELALVQHYASRVEQDSGNERFKVSYKAFELIGSLMQKYPKWNKLLQYESQFAFQNHDTSFYINDLKKMVKIKYNLRPTLEELGLYFIRIRNYDSSDKYLRILEYEFPGFCDYVRGVFLQSFGNDAAAIRYFSSCQNLNHLSPRQYFLAMLTYSNAYAGIKDYKNSADTLESILNYRHNVLLYDMFDPLLLEGREKFCGMLLYSSQFEKYVHYIKKYNYGREVIPESMIYEYTKQYYLSNKDWDRNNFDGFFTKNIIPVLNTK